jgi:hypothetical protein
VEVLVFSAASNTRLPLPLPLGALRVSHEAEDVAVHEQPAPVVTLTLLPVEAVAARENDAGDTAYVHVAPAWETLMVWPPTVTVAERLAIDVFAWRLNTTFPLPDPLAVVNVSHEAEDTAVHAQPTGAVTAEELFVDAVAANENDTGDTEYAHAAPAWLTLMVRPPTVMVPERLLEDGLACALKTTLPLPEPVAVVSVSQETDEYALQEHPSGVVTAEEFPDDASSARENDAGDTAYVHVAPAWETVMV